MESKILKENPITLSLPYKYKIININKVSYEDLIYNSIEQFKEIVEFREFR